MERGGFTSNETPGFIPDRNAIRKALHGEMERAETAQSSPDYLPRFLYYRMQTKNRLRGTG